MLTYSLLLGALLFGALLPIAREISAMMWVVSGCILFPLGAGLFLSPVLLIVTIPAAICYIFIPSLDFMIGVYLILLTFGFPFLQAIGAGICKMILHPTGFIAVFIVVFVGLYTLVDMTSGGLVFAGVVCLVGLCGLPRLGTPSMKNRNYGYIG
jgi:hypothetical protein